jgi:general L-amino acid transport system substrate-binding protein
MHRTARSVNEGNMKRVVLALVIASAAVSFAMPAPASTLDDIKARGVLNCGANGQLPGFGMPDPQGVWTGLDVDFCRAIAAAIFNDATKVKFVPLSAKDRFTALQSGDVDVLARNTTWTLSRDTQLGLNATGVNYYDGQGFIIRKSLKVNSALELNDAAICVQQGTTTELNLSDYFRTNKMRLKTVTFATLDEALKAAAATPSPPTLPPSTASVSNWPSPTTTWCCRKSSPRSRWDRLCAKAMTSGSTSCAGSCSPCSMPRN